MLEKKETPSRPLYASIASIERGRGGCRAVAILVLFGKSAEKEFTCPGNDNAAMEKCSNEAIAWVNAWNEHLDSQWLLLMESNAAVMNGFIQGLQNCGIPKSTIDKALAEVRKSASS